MLVPPWIGSGTDQSGCLTEAYSEGYHNSHALSGDVGGRPSCASAPRTARWRRSVFETARFAGVHLPFFFACAMIFSRRAAAFLWRQRSIARALLSGVNLGGMR